MKSLQGLVSQSIFEVQVFTQAFGKELLAHKVNFCIILYLSNGTNITKGNTMKL